MFTTHISIVSPSISKNPAQPYPNFTSLGLYSYEEAVVAVAWVAAISTLVDIYTSNLRDQHNLMGLR